VDRLFAPFSKRVGVANIREWEEQHAAFEHSVAKRRGELLQQVGGCCLSGWLDRSNDVAG
jgi:hypothetical protein